MVKMVKLLQASLLSFLFLGGCGQQETNQVQADLPVDKTSVAAGTGNSVTMQGGALPLIGSGAVEVGKPLPTALLSSLDLQSVEIGELKGKVRIISVVPSLDTPTCDRQTHALSEDNDGLDQQVELVSISMDLPFAQARFAKEAKIDNVTFLSDYKYRQFGNNNGLLIEPLALLARAVIVTDGENIVRYLQVVPDVAALPDMPAAMEAARSLL
ncbi:MAG: thiol peroxidase [Gammaproteobacteria bacterium]